MLASTGKDAEQCFSLPTNVGAYLDPPHLSVPLGRGLTGMKLSELLGHHLLFQFVAFWRTLGGCLSTVSFLIIKVL